MSTSSPSMLVLLACIVAKIRSPLDLSQVARHEDLPPIGPMQARRQLHARLLRRRTSSAVVRPSASISEERLTPSSLTLRRTGISACSNAKLTASSASRLSIACGHGPAAGDAGEVGELDLQSHGATARAVHGSRSAARPCRGSAAAPRASARSRRDPPRRCSPRRPTCGCGWPGPGDGRCLARSRSSTTPALPKYSCRKANDLSRRSAPVADAEAQHPSLGRRPDAMEAADLQALHEGRAPVRRDHKEPVGLALVGGELGEELVVGHARRGGEAGLLADLRPDRLRDVGGERDRPAGSR